MLKKWISIALVLSATSITKAQNEQDAFRFSRIEPGISARMAGMGGAFSSIGADGACAVVNPASIAGFRRGEFSIGMQIMSVRTKASFTSGTPISESKMRFSLPNMNLVGTTLLYDDKGKPLKTGLVSWSWGLHINRLASFHQNFSYEGKNDKSSISDYFAEVATAQNIDPGGLFVGGLEQLAFDARTIAHIPPGSVSDPHVYVSNYGSAPRNNNQAVQVDYKGNAYEYQFSGGINYSHKFLLGIGLYYSSTRFEQVIDLVENDLNSLTNYKDIAEIAYTFDASDRGNAFGARIGGIFRPNESFRLGFAIHTPKNLKLTTSYKYGVSGKFDAGSGLPGTTSWVNDEASTFEYRVVTPARFTLGAGFIIDKKMIINADCDIMDYSTMRMSAEGDAFSVTNRTIKKLYKRSLNTRFGFEYNQVKSDIKSVRYRLGFGFLSSPYNEDFEGVNENLTKLQWNMNCGLGLKENQRTFDFSLGYHFGTDNFTPYAVGNAARANYSADIEVKRIIFNLTAGFLID